jgi:hypothetical protein
MKEALVMAKELLVYEPDNKMIREYQKYITDYIAQGMDNLPSFQARNILIHNQCDQCVATRS